MNIKTFCWIWDLLFCIRYSMNRIQSKDHRLGTYEMKKFQNNIYSEQWYDGWAIGYQS